MTCGETAAVIRPFRRFAGNGSWNCVCALFAGLCCLTSLRASRYAAFRRGHKPHVELKTMIQATVTFGG